MTEPSLDELRRISRERKRRRPTTNNARQASSSSQQSSRPSSPSSQSENQPTNIVDTVADFIGEMAGLIFIGVSSMVAIALVFGVFYAGSRVFDWLTDDEQTVIEERRVPSTRSSNNTRNESQPIRSPISEPHVTVHRLSNVQSGGCNGGQFRSQGGTITIDSNSIKTNWRKIEFIYCVERGDDENYLIAEAYGNKAVGYLVIDNKSPLSKSSIYGCVLHSKYKVIRKKPASFLPITCSKDSLQSLK